MAHAERVLPRIAVLLSGRGSNFLALYEAVHSGQVEARIVAVISDKPGALGLEKARILGIPTHVFDPRDLGDRSDHTLALVECVKGCFADWVCLAGYMRILGPEFIRAFPQRILNIHPSLLPSFPGLHAQRQALEHGVRISGCTVHLVDEGLDSGPIVAQRAVPVATADDEESLSARILEQEHDAYPEALARLLCEDWVVEGRRVLFKR